MRRTLAPFAPVFALTLLVGDGTAQLYPPTKEVQASLDKARPALLKHLKQSRGNVLAPACLAVVYDEVPRTEPKFYRAASRLRDAVFTGTYGAVVLADPIRGYDSGTKTNPSES
jgi:hypothetical protein